jgi:hypothetical protein
MIALCCAASAFAGPVIPASQLPKAVTAAIQSYFPGSRITRAESDTSDGKPYYEVKITYKDIWLNVDVTRKGHIMDVEMR